MKLTVLPAIMGVGLWWGGGQLGHRTVMGHWVGLADREAWFCPRLAGLGGGGVDLGFRAVRLSHGALFL